MPNAQYALTGPAQWHHEDMGEIGVQTLKGLDGVQVTASEYFVVHGFRCMDREDRLVVPGHGGAEVDNVNARADNMRHGGIVMAA